MDKTTGYVFMVLMILSLALFEIVGAQPRAQIVNMTCGSREENNRTLFVPNFISLMEEINDLMRQFGWGTAVTGSGLDANYGLAQCYGDLSLTDCPLCYAEARTVLPQCFPYTGGRVFLDGCFMRSDNYSFYDEYLGPYDMAVCGNTSRKGSSFQAAARQAVSQAVTTALNNGGHYAKAQVAGSGTNNTAYVLVNCWRTLNRSSCEACYENASAAMLRCLPWSEGRALYTGCFMRYSDIDFLNKEPGNGSSRGTIITIVVSTVSSLLVLAVLAAIGAYIWNHRNIQKKRDLNDAEQWVKVLRDSNLNFKYSTLEKATGSFDEANKLGQGGFGTVYKGALPDGREIAVKRLFFNNRLRAADFYNEVNIISSVEHKNLVRLLGCSCSGPESLLVYEFLPNKSLDSFIFDPSRGKELTWEKRYQIIIGTVEGLVYLHENPTNKIIHRDIKASNILLDLRFRAKIADFGLARSLDEDRSHVSTAVAGTLGYMAPEYLANGQLTEKADVYSFGVLLLEIITGKQNNGSRDTDYSDSIIAVAWNHFQSGTAEEIYDPILMSNDNDQRSDVKNQIYRVLHIGLLCTQEARSLRPSMSKVLQMLTKKDEELPPPTSPPFMDEQTMEFNNVSENERFPLNSGGTDSVATVGHSSFHPR
ncbi:cysteine-rich RLK (RECEPTOR-like protein kinase) 2, ALTERED SEED GERMINATION 6, CYSTEINE-RICH RLK2 [Hibiscus trionum]|uniref:Cysteine-rich RLK (RECEPTOR-like protein kinase) 2, ALTERED SEED GERMINATION 6, CYSTEINE-RICH RLK2 n=1 Tax=Hibiscus trionum TaxID=183268 RepID=A0A9W7I6C1_HIBTR|nr:cysteine-rich RLK (RECEPTOR-like protein kinase) 2, ALTERED SEED GERMINATION 6, CYSTEINE-RICH RLK2 [Hibiscus trionum]